MDFKFAYTIPYNVTPLAANDPEHKRIADLMKGDYLVQISDILKIDNPYLKRQFCVKYHELKLFNDQIIIKELLHSTNTVNVQSIIENNFDWRLARRVKYGHGVSFSPFASYANLHSSSGYKVSGANGSVEVKAMFVVDVIVGNTQIGNNRVVIPDWPIDTTINKDESVFVKYYDHEFYPKYVIFYVSYPVVSLNGKRTLCKD